MMSEMPELELEDVVQGRTAGIVCWHMHPSGPRRVTLVGAYRITWVDTGCAALSMVGVHTDTAVLTRIKNVGLAPGLTIHRDGEQIWPKPVPSIKEQVSYILGGHPERCDQWTRTADGFAEELVAKFNITRKENR